MKLINSAVLCLGAALALTGCGGGKGEVSGTVKYQGKPLPEGTITFYDGGHGAWSSPIKEGAYKVPGVTAGATKIAVQTPIPIAFGSGPAPKTTSIPPKYNDPEKSGLTYQVQAGSQTHDLNLD